MLDTNILLNLDEDTLKKFEARGLEKTYILGLAQAFKKIREAKAELEALQAKKNKLVDKFAQIKAKADADIFASDLEDIKKELSSIKESIQKYQSEVNKISDDFNREWVLIPNLPLDNEIPVGDESKNKVLRYWGKPREFDFQPLNHWDILEKQGMVDFKRAVKQAGTRFITYKEKGARLMRALQWFTLDINIKNGYKEILPPVIVNEKSFYSSGQLPKFKADVFQLENSDLYLSSTGEVQLVNFYRDEIIPGDQLPILFTTSTINFRSEAGSAGKDIRGLIRLHQFYKTELVKICKVEDGVSEHEKTVLNACEILEKLNLPYRQLLLASQDMSASAQKTYDLEVWLPGSNKYREISSISLCGTYQARRAKIRYNTGTVGDNKYVATINGSSLALDRLFAAIVENYQNADGSFSIPPALEKYM